MMTRPETVNIPMLLIVLVALPRSSTDLLVRLRSDKLDLLQSRTVVLSSRVLCTLVITLGSEDVQLEPSTTRSERYVTTQKMYQDARTIIKMHNKSFNL